LYLLCIAEKIIEKSCTEEIFSKYTQIKNSLNQKINKSA